MKKYYFILTILGLCTTLLFTQCKKSDLSLSGTASQADFTFVQSPASDTLPYAYKVTFTSTSTGEFIYQWNFGDNSDLSAEKKRNL